MDGLRQTPDNAERAFWSWLGFWLQILVLGVLAINGAFAASAADRPGEFDNNGNDRQSQNRQRHARAR